MNNSHYTLVLEAANTGALLFLLIIYETNPRCPKDAELYFTDPWKSKSSKFISSCSIQRENHFFRQALHD